MIDYEKLTANLDKNKVIELVKKMGADHIIERENCFITNTICHNIDNGSEKLYYYYDTHIFYCYTECSAMSVFTFLKHYYETRNIEYDWYTDIILVVKNCSPSSTIENFGIEKYEKLKDKFKRIERKVDLPTYPAGVLDVFQKIYPVQWMEEGISKNALDKFNILFSSSQNKIIIPHYNVNGNLVGIRGRALNEWEVENLGKYMPVQIENKWYNHKLSLNLYGLNVTKENIKKSGYVYLFEGEKSILKMEDVDEPNCSAAICGSNLNKFQIDILMKECNPKEVILCLDREEKDNEEKYYNKLRSICLKYKNYADFSFIYDDKGLTHMKDSPIDCGKEIFYKLRNKRRKVK